MRSKTKNDKKKASSNVSGSDFDEFLLKRRNTLLRRQAKSFSVNSFQKKLFLKIIVDHTFIYNSNSIITMESLCTWYNNLVEDIIKQVQNEEENPTERNSFRFLFDRNGNNYASCDDFDPYIIYGECVELWQRDEKRGETPSFNFRIPDVPPFAKHLTTVLNSSYFCHKLTRVDNIRCIQGITLRGTTPKEIIFKELKTLKKVSKQKDL